jgi:uncharacterized protein (DUF924 family)
MSDQAAIRDILDFWYLPKDHPDHGRPRDIWWKSTPDFDAEIERRFGELIEQAAAGELEAWADTAEGALALIILCDQFTRNIYRKTPKAYCGDPTALAAARKAVAHGYPQGFARDIRTFFYTPFHHSEALADQEMAVALFDSIADDKSKAYGRGHRDVVARFGRFPHRNEVLGRTSTPEEIEFLKTAERYGQ